jgi:hypothetical protein
LDLTSLLDISLQNIWWSRLSSWIPVRTRAITAPSSETRNSRARKT